MQRKNIVISETDLARLRSILGSLRESASHDQEHLHELKYELDRARVVAEDAVPEDVVAMRSRVHVRDLVSNTTSEYTLVFPNDADLAARRISVLAPLGTALLGFRAGDEFEWKMPGGLRRLSIERVTHEATEDHPGAGAATA